MLNSVSLTNRTASPRLSRRLRYRWGMSLMELLIVMGVLSTVVAISWPALRRPLNRSHAQTAAQQLQRDLLTTRRAAMESGQVHWFQYQPESGTYYCGTHRQFSMVGARDNGAVETSLRDNEAESSTGALDQHAELPEGSTFVNRSPVPLVSTKGKSRGIDSGSGFNSNDEVENNETARSRRTDPALESATTGWSRPLRFYPSGRMESAQISLASQDGYDILVEIQGLAGRVKIHSLERNNVEPTEALTEDRRAKREPGESNFPHSPRRPQRGGSD